MSAQGNVAEGGSSVPGSTQLGRYSLICEIAKAQFGALWAGAADGEMVLVRRIARASADVLALGKMMEAATALSGLEIAGFIEVKDVVGGTGEIGVVSEYREGEVLRALLRHAVFKRSPLSPPVAVRIAVDILEALDAARDAEQVAFGCVWPDNILVGTDGQTRVMDLGISAIVGADGALSHHPELETYSAPERLADTPSADARSDVFAVGILLWEMIANQRLFSGTSAATAKQKVATAPIARLDTSKVGAPVGGPLADIVQRALERNPADRYPDTAALLAALKALGPEAVASPSEVAGVIEKLAGPVLGLRRRAIDKALARAAGGDQQTSRAPPVVARPTLEGVAPMAKGAAPAPPLRGASATGTLLGVPSPAGVSLPQGSVVVSPPPGASRRPLPPPPKRSLRRTGALDESGEVHGLSSDPDSSGRHESLDHLLEHVGGPKLAGSLDALTSKPPGVTESDKKAAREPAAEPRVAKAEPAEPGTPLPSFEDEPPLDESASATKRASPAPESPPKTMTVDSNRSASSPEAAALAHTEERKPLAVALAGISTVRARLLKSRAVVRGTEFVKKHGGELLKNPKVVRGTELVKKRGAELMKNRTAVRAAIAGVGALLLIAIIIGISRPKETATEPAAAMSVRSEPASSQAATVAAAPEPSAAPPPSAAAPPAESATAAATPPPAPPKHAVATSSTTSKPATTKSSSTFLGSAKKTTSGKTTTTTAKSKSPTTTTTAKKKTTSTTTR